MARESVLVCATGVSGGDKWLLASKGVSGVEGTSGAVEYRRFREWR